MRRIILYRIDTIDQFGEEQIMCYFYSLDIDIKMLKDVKSEAEYPLKFLSVNMLMAIANRTAVIIIIKKFNLGVR